MKQETAGYRTEADFLGEKQIPADVYYGVQTARAVENFPITGYKVHEEMIKALAIVKKRQRLQIWIQSACMRVLEMRLCKQLMKS